MLGVRYDNGGTFRRWFWLVNFLRETVAKK